MKRIACFLLSAVLLLCLAACGKDADKKKTATTLDLEYYAESGQIPECSVRLGADVEELKSELEKKLTEAESTGEEYVYNVTEGEKSVLIENGAFQYYYEKERAEQGIALIVSFDTAFGIEPGTSILEVKNLLSESDCEEVPADSDNAFFVYDITDGEVLRCTEGDIVFLFVFSESALCATAIYNAQNWTI